MGSQTTFKESERMVREQQLAAASNLNEGYQQPRSMTLNKRLAFGQEG